MSDDKKNQDGRDRSKVSGTEDYEVEYLAKKLNVSADVVKEAIGKVGNNREDLERHIKEGTGRK